MASNKKVGNLASNRDKVGKKRSKAEIRNIVLNSKSIELDLAENNNPEELFEIEKRPLHNLKHRMEDLLNEDNVLSEESDEFAFDDDVSISQSLNDNYELNDEEEMAFNRFIKPQISSTKEMMNEFNSNYTYQKANINEYAQEIKSQELPPLVVETYRNVGLIMRRYRSGLIPKAFKIVPILDRWLEIFSLMEPERWTAAAVFQATRYFISSGKPSVCEKFINYLILPRVRDDIGEYKKLNYHIQNALKMSTRKPGAFFKGFLIPLCQEGDCTLREAVLIGGILRQCRIPVLHSSVAMLKIATMDYSGANSLFLQIFLKKNYALPYRVLDALVDHFIRFLHEQRLLPVLWHQCLLTFVQGYGKFLAEEQKELLLDLCKIQKHAQITPEVRKAVVSSSTQ